MKIIVLGSSGMLGNAMLGVLSQRGDFDVIGSYRTSASISRLPDKLKSKCRINIDINDSDQLLKMFDEHKPNVIINCIGLIKQISAVNDPLITLPLNSIFPHRLNAICKLSGTRLIHISTDCVFSGKKGMYLESDIPDAEDLYGRSKLLGELNSENSITLRTSIVGRELSGSHSLIDWFLSQKHKISGYSNAYFSGLTTVELSRVIRDTVLCNEDLHGLYHVSSSRISKYNLLKEASSIFNHKILIEEYPDFFIDRSLDNSKFTSKTNYVCPSWTDMLLDMKNFYSEEYNV
ncbi:SDR family oxidoreductase [Leeia sp. TBRC 13508]|uniref:dTDP-4-dehydrorhamnose reductase n=1 Tax=Leeia speluncae TaxID=2884804 RepID=A0ABS8D457_9NEIS|nr:SDR family oxidoreductase [Leeia speluncae]MCB6182788.1 SDR family oxidoreductase [Leeia speluncae]